MAVGTSGGIVGFAIGTAVVGFGEVGRSVGIIEGNAVEGAGVTKIDGSDVGPKVGIKVG